MFFGLFWGDWTILVVAPALIFALWAQSKVNNTFNKYAKIHNRRGMTGAEAARRVLDANGLYHITIERVHGRLTDHFDPKEGVIRLSDAVYASTGIAALGVAAHEAGHAVQHAEGYAPIRLRSAIIPLTRFGSMLAMPLFVLGFIYTLTYIFLIELNTTLCNSYFLPLAAYDFQNLLFLHLLKQLFYQYLSYPLVYETL